jgi:hypothetical protein
LISVQEVVFHVHGIIFSEMWVACHMQSHCIVLWSPKRVAFYPHETLFFIAGWSLCDAAGSQNGRSTCTGRYIF